MADHGGALPRALQGESWLQSQQTLTDTHCLVELSQMAERCKVALIGGGEAGVQFDRTPPDLHCDGMLAPQEIGHRERHIEEEGVRVIRRQAMCLLDAADRLVLLSEIAMGQAGKAPRQRKARIDLDGAV